MITGDNAAHAREYYDGFARKLLAEHVYGNTRLEAAITHAVRWIPPNAEKVLDVGVGIGWSTFEIARHFPEAMIRGIDLSPKLIDIAQRLFNAPTISFAVTDITTAEDIRVDEGSTYEAIIMLDVYEHIPRSLRTRTHRILNQALGRNGVVILSFPSVMHQEYLRNSRPALLQPVDEDVTFDDIAILACDLTAHISQYNHVSLGYTNDYVHAVLQREPTFRRVRAVDRAVALEDFHDRKKRVNRRLGVRVTRAGLVLGETRGPRICIAAPQEAALSETFIRAHAELLPADVKLLHGGRMPLHCEDEALLRRTPMRRLWRGAIGRAFRVREGHFEIAALTAFLKREAIRLVMAEYGPVGLGLLEPCKRSGVPLVVHFHGADAYADRFISSSDAGYQRLFDYADAIVAVSRDMEEQLRRLGAPAEKVHYNPCGVDCAMFHGAKPRDCPPTFLAVGRFVEKKAPFLTLLAFHRVLAEHSDARLIMIGEGPLREACVQMGLALGCGDKASFPGPLPHVAVAQSMRRVRAFVQHSLRPEDGDSEGTPVAVLEAGASGLPVVATRHGGIRDVVLHGETGLLVDEGDVSEMAEMMLRLAKDGELAERMGQSARERVCAEFSMEKSIANLWRILETVIARNQSS